MRMSRCWAEVVRKGFSEEVMFAKDKGLLPPLERTRKGVPGRGHTVQRPWAGLCMGILAQ